MVAGTLPRTARITKGKTPPKSRNAGKATARKGAAPAALSGMTRGRRGS